MASPRRGQPVGALACRQQFYLGRELRRLVFLLSMRSGVNNVAGSGAFAKQLPRAGVGRGCSGRSPAAVVSEPVDRFLQRGLGIGFGDTQDLTEACVAR